MADVSEILELLEPDPWEQDRHQCVYQETPDGYGCVRCIYG